MIVCIIPAKEHSRRLDHKNMQFIKGKPLVDYTIAYAKKSKLIGKIFVSTDSDAIAAHCAASGVEVIKRDESLGGEADVLGVYRDALNKIQDIDVEYMVCLQPDHPDRNIDLDQVIRLALEKKYDDLISVDKDGKRNGSLRLISMEALRSGKLSQRLWAVKDDCTNIHTQRDLIFAAFRMREPKSITVAGKIISRDSPVFVIAEAANNHMCDIGRAKLMIDKASEAGADAIKFQTYKAERLVVRTAMSYWSYGGAAQTQLSYYKNLDKFNKEEYLLLFDYARKKGLIGFSTPFDVESARVLNDAGMLLFKIPSACIPDKRLLRFVAGLKKPIIMSTGGSDLEEIREAVTVILEQGNDQLILMACMMSYPTSNQEAHILRVKALQKEFPDFIIGLSDHTDPDLHMVIPSLGVALGAKVIEKHYTLDRKMTGSGHSFSVEPQDLKKMIENIRLTEIVMGRETIEVTAAEKSARQGARGSLVANRDIAKGERLDNDMVAVKRPGTGLSPAFIDQVIGKTALKDFKDEEQISFENIV